MSNFSLLFAEDLQQKAFSGSVSKYARENECDADQPGDPTQNPFNGKSKND
jgi:hypothetical protein